VPNARYTELTSTADERSVTIVKFRGSGFRSGKHSLRLTSTGMQVFPRLLPGAYGTEFVQQTIPSGIAELDEMLRKGINIPVEYMSERGTLSLVTIEPLHYMPDEFARLVRRDVEEYSTRIVMIDSISGYRLSMRGQDLVMHLHAGYQLPGRQHYHPALFGTQR
jgi:circadian clock protein KaiC